MTDDIGAPEQDVRVTIILRVNDSDDDNVLYSTTVPASYREARTADGRKILDVSHGIISRVLREAADSEERSKRCESTIPWADGDTVQCDLVANHVDDPDPECHEHGNRAAGRTWR